MALGEIRPDFSPRDIEKIKSFSLKYKSLLTAQERGGDGVKAARVELNLAKVSLIEEGAAGGLDSDPKQIVDEARRIVIEPIEFPRLAVRAERLIRENEARGIGLPR